MIQICCISGICLICLETLKKKENEIHVPSFCSLKINSRIQPALMSSCFYVVYGIPSFSCLKIRTLSHCLQRLSWYIKSLRQIHWYGNWGPGPKALTAFVSLGALSFSNLLYSSGFQWPLSSFFLALFRLNTALLDQKDWSKIDMRIGFGLCCPSASCPCWLIFVETTVSWENSWFEEMFDYWFLKLEIALWDEREGPLWMNVLIFIVIDITMPILYLQPQEKEWTYMYMYNHILRGVRLYMCMFIQ